MKRPREWFLSIPPTDYDDCPVAWQTEEYAKNCQFHYPRRAKNGPLKGRIEYSWMCPIEVVHVRELPPKRGGKRSTTARKGGR